MKLATLLLGILMATTGTAAADEVLHPPGGPVYVSDPPPMHAQGDLPPRALRRGDMMRGERGPRGQRGQGMRGDLPRGERGQRARQLRRALVATFDLNGDGRLGPRERMRAARVLHRIEGRLMAAPGEHPRGGAHR